MELGGATTDTGTSWSTSERTFLELNKQGLCVNMEHQFSTDFADVILIGDSSVGFLKSHLSQRQDVKMDVNSYSGANIVSLSRTAEYLAKKNYYEYIYIFGGINDVTIKDYCSGKVAVNYENADDIHTTLMARYVECYKNIKDANCDTNYRITHCTAKVCPSILHLTFEITLTSVSHFSNDTYFCKSLFN